MARARYNRALPFDVSNLCRGRFEVEGRDRWTVVSRVSGPRKDLWY